MQYSDPFSLELDSDEFHLICNEMNQLKPDSSGVPSFDGMSGGFKFSDEVPLTISEGDSPLVLPLVTLLRCLWGYRVSLVCGKPRSDLVKWWTAANIAAPNWPGFLAERNSIVMQPFVDRCKKSSRRMTETLDELDQACRADGLVSRP